MSYTDNIILTDIDGVCLNFDHAFELWMKDNGYDLKITGTYDLQKAYGVEDPEMTKFLVKMFIESSAFESLPPMKDAIKYIRKLHEEHGFVFHAITAVHNTETVRNSRLKNLQKLFGESSFERLFLCDSSENKGVYLEQYKNSGCFWIEDHPENAKLGFEYGLSPILFNQHYNTNVAIDIARVSKWKEIYNLIS